MTRQPHNDIRANHQVHVFLSATNVKFKYLGYEISLAADGKETIVFSEEGVALVEFIDTGARQVADAVAWIEDRQGETA